MPMEPTTLSQFLAEQLPGSPDSPGLGCLLADVATAVQNIAAITARGALADAQPELPLAAEPPERSTRLASSESQPQPQPPC